MGRELEKSETEEQLQDVWEEAEERVRRLASFEIEETRYRDIKKTAYKPSWTLNLSKGIGKKWDFFDTEEINDLMNSVKFSIVDGWGDRYGIDFEVEAATSVKTTDNDRHFDRGEYVPHVQIKSLDQNENGGPLISAEIRYTGPKANPEGITEWSSPDYIKVDISFNTTDPKYSEAYEALDLLINSDFEDYSDIIGTKWHKDARSV